MQSAVVAVPPGQQAVVPTQPHITLNTKAIAGLGVTQIIIGILCGIIGVIAIVITDSYWVRNNGAGIWAGGWILVTGILGVCAAKSPRNNPLIGVHLAFNIIATIIAFLDGIFFAIALGYYNLCTWYPRRYYYYVPGGYYTRTVTKYRYSYIYGRSSTYTGYLTSYKSGYYTSGYSSYSGCNSDREKGLGVYAPLLLFMVVEFFVALVAAIYCCSGSGCCNQQTEGVIVTQQPGQTVHYIQTSHAQPVATSQPVYNNEGQFMYMQGQQPMVMYSQPMPMSSNVHPQPISGQVTMSGQPMASGGQQVPATGQGINTSAPPSYAYPGAQTNVSYTHDPSFQGQFQQKTEMPPAYSA